MNKCENWINKNILVIEDDIPSAEFLTEILISRGCKVFHAENGEEGLSKFKSQTIHLVLLDIQLPEMNGYQIAEAIRKIDDSVPIIAQTARAFAEDREKCLEAGCNDYITKPIPYSVLVNTISVYLNES